MIVFSFSLLLPNLNFHSTLFLSVLRILLSLVCYRITLLLSYPNILLFLYLRITECFFFCSYLPKISSSFILDLELFLMFASYLTLHPCSIYTCVLGLLGGDFDCIYFLDLMVPYCTVFVDRIWCVVMASWFFCVRTSLWGKAEFAMASQCWEQQQRWNSLWALGKSSADNVV